MRAAWKRAWRARTGAEGRGWKIGDQSQRSAASRSGGRDHRPAQMVRRLSRAARHQSDRGARRAHRDLRSVGRRQIDAAALHQSAGGLAARPHRRRRHRTDRRSQADHRRAARCRHGVSAFQSVSASHRAGELHAGADLGAPYAEERRRGTRHELSQARQNPGTGAKISGAAVRRPAAARRHRARACA